MTMTRQLPGVRQSTRLFFRTACAMVAYIVLGFASALPLGEKLVAGLEQTGWGRAVIAIVALGVAAVALLHWGAALWYARTSPDVISHGVTLVLLILSGFVGAFFYYWLVVHWRESTCAASRPPNPHRPNAATA